MLAVFQVQKQYFSTQILLMQFVVSICIPEGIGKTVVEIGRLIRQPLKL